MYSIQLYSINYQPLFYNYNVKRIKTRSEAQTNGLEPIHAEQMGEIGEERKSLAKGTNVTLVHIK